MKPSYQKLLMAIVVVLIFIAGMALFFSHPKQVLAPILPESKTSSTTQASGAPSVTTPSLPSVTTPSTSDASQHAQTPSLPKPASNPSIPPAPVSHADATTLASPLPGALARVTKKPFGIYITKQNSPVQPERFSGYHTGVDFETTPDEQTKDVSVSAVCDGKLLMKKWATGYGGVAVQSCNLNGKSVTIIYGHLRITSVRPKVGDTLKAGETFAVLGKGYSTETDGERRHLHLGIHLGTSVNILGYVQVKSALSQWLDVRNYLVGSL